MISICSLIYRSPRYADAVWDSAHEFTEELQDGRARFFFVANDATPEVIEHLVEKCYPFVMQENARLTHDQLKNLGFDSPEYIRRVYQGWNRAILESDEQMVLVNSDCMFSPGWLTTLLSHYIDGKVICSKLVERCHPRHGANPFAWNADFGDHPVRFKKEQFLSFCKGKQARKLEPGGAYMPLLMSRAKAIKAGLYPEGNRIGKFGDQEFFERLARSKCAHFTALDSLVYHFKEGEMDE